MRQSEANRDAAQPARSPSRSRRLVLLGGSLFGAASLVVFFTCDTNTILPGQNGTTNGLCTYPQGCYVVNASGVNQGQCDDDGCSTIPKGPPSCRQVFTPKDPVNYLSVAGDQSGTWMFSNGIPVPADWQAVCGLGYTPPADKVAVCIDPELVCIARGVACTGSCVHLTLPLPNPDAGTTGLCADGVQVPPQRRPGATDGGTQTYCPLTDDVCCPNPMPDGGGAMDGGAVDGGGVVDGGAVD